MPVPQVARSIAPQSTGTIDSQYEGKRNLAPPVAHSDRFSSLPSVFDYYNVGWIKKSDGSQFVIRSPAIDIQAPIGDVWEVVKDVNQYGHISNGAINAEVDGKVAVGKDIAMKIFPKKCVGKVMGTSVETISLVDDAMKIIGWSRHLPLSGDTERYHVLEAMGPNTTRSYIALKLPGVLGGISSLLFGRTIGKAFSALNKGIRKQSESVDFVK